MEVRDIKGIVQRYDYKRKVRGLHMHSNFTQWLNEVVKVSQYLEAESCVCYTSRRCIIVKALQHCSSLQPPQRCPPQLQPSSQAHQEEQAHQEAPA